MGRVGLNAFYNLYSFLSNKIVIKLIELLSRVEIFKSVHLYIHVQNDRCRFFDIGFLMLNHCCFNTLYLHDLTRGGGLCVCFMFCYVVLCVLSSFAIILRRKRELAVILLPAHPASFAHKFLFHRVPASPRMQ